MTQKLEPLIKLYNGLSPAARRAGWALLAFEVVLIGVAERDIQRRPAGRTRGPKLLWRAVATQNVIGPRGLLRHRPSARAMSATAVGDLVVLVLVTAAAFWTGWVLRDAQARGLPRRKALDLGGAAADRVPAVPVAVSPHPAHPPARHARSPVLAALRRPRARRGLTRSARICPETWFRGDAAIGSH